MDLYGIAVKVSSKVALDEIVIPSEPKNIEFFEAYDAGKTTLLIMRAILTEKNPYSITTNLNILKRQLTENIKALYGKPHQASVLKRYAHFIHTADLSMPHSPANKKFFSSDEGKDILKSIVNILQTMKTSDLPKVFKECIKSIDNNLDIASEKAAEDTTQLQEEIHRIWNLLQSGVDPADIEKKEFRFRETLKPALQDLRRESRSRAKSPHPMSAEEMADYFDRAARETIRDIKQGAKKLQ